MTAIAAPYDPQARGICSAGPGSACASHTVSVCEARRSMREPSRRRRFRIGRTGHARARACATVTRARHSLGARERLSLRSNDPERGDRVASALADEQGVRLLLEAAQLARLGLP